MKYLMMVLGSQADYDAMKGRPSAHSPAWSEQDLQTMFDYMNAINDDLTRSGEMVDGQGLVDPAKTRFVTLDDAGKPVIRDAPYGQTQEVLAGYWLVDCASLERVTEIAARVAACPVPAGTPDYPVVIRQIDEAGPSLETQDTGAA
ncbi:YciI family protein [Streptomyces coeruleoprunus]|uniref:YciI family protein n=1 Tax=Streptomyces coeruleoprunus TaxID=285563 RepID=A0ABV9XBC3_9ACTN